jgi:hypothetical protein
MVLDGWFPTLTLPTMAEQSEVAALVVPSQEDDWDKFLSGYFTNSLSMN